MKIHTRTGRELFATPAKLKTYAAMVALGLFCTVSTGCGKGSDPHDAPDEARNGRIEPSSNGANPMPSPTSTEPAASPQVHKTTSAPPSSSASDQLASRKALDSLAQEIKANGVGSDEISDLSALFLKEPRDEAWASSAEYTISNVAANLNRKYGSGLEVAKASCRQTLCELQVVNRKGVGGSPLDWNIAYRQLKNSLKSSNSQTIMRPLPDGQVVYHTYIIR
ncbi:MULTISPECIES: hypothetical protein [unclassified Lysobacter]|uniref:hypothetical protein n=1 Tax=unclassified Lysobacter TaxID=2635362 RepID=UPI001BE551BA|nr:MULTISPECIES: hypothetical protein [unclassified Lysobacter]MBT2747337.1 hypothetical protein [Lysobacter sp. ISL-42]MBT2752231.1 hypothetical protein [Lysobacter sp. ISL-50]MBT2779001.1 hypothetical protein [Lysobacter sp. ISL-54]MBT2783613.1 hypothetical protein [Lysobacter sp. ISL-52]